MKIIQQYQGWQKQPFAKPLYLLVETDIPRFGFQGGIVSAHACAPQRIVPCDTFRTVLQHIIL